ncbi:MAG: hypothetical protein BroJett011_19470 [Chloroflexota bacterium]|nr:MAG: hypothetical protein BroJett011_19470 [Chloroflexota bacterium]
MSCDQNTNRISRLICTGLTHMSNKRGFYAGLALGGAGLVGAGLLARARRHSDPGRGQPAAVAIQATPNGLGRVRHIPQLQARPKIKPTTKLGSSDRCASCRTPAGSKPGAWYIVSSRVYCPDCAPNAANQIGADLAVPEPVANEVVISGMKGAGTVVTSSRPNPTSSKIPVVSTSLRQPDVLNPDRMVKTKLMPASIKICIGKDVSGPVYVIANDGYVVLRAGDGGDTGMAITPTLILPAKPGDDLSVDLTQWNLTHINSGTVITGKAYETIEEAQMLASILAQLDWTKEEYEISTEEIRKTNATISMFNQAMSVRKKQQQSVVKAAQAPSTAAPGQGVTSADLTGPVAVVPLQQGLTMADSLTGKVMADRYGGISRVVHDSGDILLMVDSMGERYEVERAAVYPPTEQDYQTSRIAMPVDPTQRSGEKCAKCGQLTSQARTGEKWYRLNYQTFCPSCGIKYAHAEDFEMEEIVGSEVG